MKWSAISFDWNQVRAFLATANEGSLSAAARALGLTQPTLSRQVAALETDLGVMLFERVGKMLVLTEAGRGLLVHVREMGEAATRLSLAAAGQSQVVEGPVSITAPDVTCAYILPPILSDLRAAYPNLDIDLVAANDVRDLARREADIALRNVPPEQPDLIARRLRDDSAYLFASRTYLSRLGRPNTPGDLASHELLGFGPPEEMEKAMHAHGITLPAANIRLHSESAIVVWEMARRGLGVTFMSARIAETAPEMERILPDLPPIRIPLWLVTHRELHTSRRIRAVFDTLVDRLTD